MTDFSFRKEWNFSSTRQVSTADFDQANDPDSDLGAALVSFLETIGVSLPAGGTAGMVLRKQSSVDGDADWEALVFPVGIPDLGSTGQVLAKASNDDGDVEWVNAPEPANTASAVSYLGSAGLVAANVEAALDELDTEKAAASHTHSQANVTDLVADLANKVETVSAGIQLDYGTALPAAGNEGRFFVVVPA